MIKIKQDNYPSGLVKPVRRSIPTMACKHKRT